MEFLHNITAAFHESDEISQSSSRTTMHRVVVA
jgi:hypothetical protein